MTLPWRISADDLDPAWASRADAPAELPKLVRRLLWASVPLASLTMRADAGVRLGGWDGVVVASAEHPFCPAGPSVWELSVAKDVRSKLNDDFDRRAAEPPDRIDPASCTYVAVTARRFPAKAKWAHEKTQAGPWQRVVVFDTNNLTSTLKTTPTITH